MQKGGSQSRFLRETGERGKPNDEHAQKGSVFGVEEAMAKDLRVEDEQRGT